METQTVKTQEGKNINCQLVLICIGMKPDVNLSKTVFGKLKIFLNLLYTNFELEM